AALLEGGCEVITLDAYYNPQAHLTFEERARLNYDHPAALDWVLLEQHLADLVRGQAIDEPVYLFSQHTRAKESRHVAPGRFLILEGILTLHQPHGARIRSAEPASRGSHPQRGAA